MKKPELHGAVLPDGWIADAGHRISPIDKHLDAILRASGSTLGNFETSAGALQTMRTALSAAVAELAPASAAPAGELSDEQIDALHKIAVDECAEQLGIPADALRTDTSKVASFRRTFARVIEFAADLALRHGAADQSVIKNDEHLFELWWAEYMQKDTQDRAWEAWNAAPKCDGVGVAAPQPPAVQPASAAELTPEVIDAAYRKVWSTIPHARRLTAFAHEIWDARQPVAPAGDAALPAIGSYEKPLVRQSDALAALAAKDAEIGKMKTLLNESGTELIQGVRDLAKVVAERDTARKLVDRYMGERDKLAAQLADASKDTHAICEIDRVMLHVAGDWPDLETDAMVVRHVKQLTRTANEVLAEVEALRKDANLRIADAFGRMWYLSDEHLGLAMKRYPELTERLVQIATADKVFAGAAKAVKP